MVTDPLIGRLVDSRYEIVDRLARGGMATVYRAHDRRLDRTVALKLMHAHLADSPDFVSRFRREARAAARLSNPGVVAVYDQGSLDGVAYLVMEYIDGIPLDQTDALHAAGINVTQIGRRLGENYAKQIIEDGFFHGDPHPGNIRVRAGGIVWLDLGMMGRLSNRDRAALRRAILALATHDTIEMKAAVLALGIVKGRINHAQLYQDIDVMMEQYGSLDFTDVHMGVLTNQILGILRVHHIGCPSGLAMFARGVMTVEIVMRRCAPEVSFLEIFARSLSLGIVHGMTWREGLTKARQEGLMLLRKSVQIPEQLADLLKMTMSGQAKLNIDLTGSEEPVQRLDKMINKLILALLCAASLIASSTLCTTDMQPQIGGIPVIGLLGYLIAFILSLRLIWDIPKGV